MDAAYRRGGGGGGGGGGEFILLPMFFLFVKYQTRVLLWLNFF